MKVLTTIYAAALLVVVIFFGLFFTPVKLEQVQAPHHVFYVSICGVAQSAIVTVSPPIYVSDDYLPTPSTIALMVEAHKAGRISVANIVFPGCPPPLPDVEERT